MLNIVRTTDRIIPISRSAGLSWPWSYQPGKSNRDMRLDLLRGFCLFVMAIDHIGVFGPDTWLYSVTGKGDFFVSAAEGFVFISGLVMGMVYCKLIAREGLAKAMPKILSRIGRLYLLAVGLTLFFVALATYTPLKLWAERDWIAIKNPIELIVGSFTLHFAFHGSSIMVMYVLFIALTPLIFYAFTRRKAWIVLAISWAVWLGNMFYPDQFTIPFQSNFPFASWQTVFVTGISIGYYRNQLAAFLKPQLRTLYYTFVSFVAVSLLAFFVLDKSGLAKDTFLANIDYKQFLADLQDKGKLPIERMAAVFIIFQAMYLFATWIWIPLQKAIGWFLIPIGEAGLYVFSLHLGLIVLVYNIPGFTNLPYVWYGLAELAAISLLWVAVKTRFLYNIIPN